MNKLRTLLLLEVLLSLTIFSCQDDNRSQKPTLPENNFVAEFTVTPSTLSAAGGSGRVMGKIKEVTVSGVVVKEMSIRPEEFLLELIGGNEAEITLDVTSKQFEVVAGPSTIFHLQATVLEGKCKGTSQQLTVVRSGALSYEFYCTPTEFPSDGGSGAVTCIRTITDASGETISTETVSPQAFDLILKSGAADEISIDVQTKSYTVSSGTEATTFVLEASIPGVVGAIQEFTLQRAAKKSPQPEPTPDPAPLPVGLLPLAYFAEYNMATEGVAFASSQANDSSGLFSWQEAVNRFKDVTIGKVRYHLPTREELYSIVPKWATKRAYVLFNEKVDQSDASETVSICGELVTGKSDFLAYGDNTCYAIRFKGTSYHSAWVYSYADNKYGDGKILIILARPLSPNDKFTPKDITKDSFWKSNNEQDILRVFPACGQMNPETKSVENQGDYGFYWSQTEDYMGKYLMNFSSFNACSTNDALFHTWGKSVRLIQTVSTE